MTDTAIIAQILGGRAGVGRKTSTQLELAEAVLQGFAAKAIDAVKTVLGLTDAQLALGLGVSPKTLGRLRKSPKQHLDALVSDRLYRFARLMALATSVLEDRDAARAWLTAPQIALNGKKPLDLASSEAGAREVEDLLGRIEHGVLA